ncbi:glycosyltransferase family 2 protein, partial [Nostoc sp. NIES-2111]
MSTKPTSAASSEMEAGHDAGAPIVLSLVVPAFNEEKGIEALVNAAADALAAITPRFEIIVVDDGSRDSTRALLLARGETIPQLRSIFLRINSGQHIATFIGLTESRGEFVFVADADQAASLSGLATLYQVALDDHGADIVTGVRETRSRSLHRSIGSQVVSWIVNRMSGTKLSDPAAPIRLYRRSTVAGIVGADVLAQNLPILTALLGYRIKEVPIPTTDSGRSSRYGLTRLIHVLLLAVLNFSAGTRTILFMLTLGAVSTMAGFAGMAGLTIYG